jgi:FkbM family methyltransferase
MRLRKLIKKLIYGNRPGGLCRFPYFGTTVYFARGSIIFNMACDQGIYEKDVTRLVEKLVKPESCYFDVGANIGLMSIPALVAEPTCRVVSCEASPNVLPHLARTRQESRFMDRWHVVPKAVGESAGVAAFSVCEPYWSAFDGLRTTERARYVRQVEVPVTTLDVEWEALNRPRVSVIKIDVEGAEMRVLKGGRNLLAAEKPFILLEWNASNLAAYECETGAILEWADGCGYALAALPSLAPVGDRRLLEAQMQVTESFLLYPSDYESD